MVRWLRMAAIGMVISTLIAVGIGVGLFLVENDRWEAVNLHPWLAEIAGERPREAWMPALMAGWLVAVLLAGGLLSLSMFYVWRRQQYERLITRLERELVTLRNLPFTEPAPLEDELAELPDPELAEFLSDAQRMLEADLAAGED